ELELGLRFFQAGRLGEAAAACSRHLSAQPQDPNALHLLGRVYLKGGQAGDAAAVRQKAADAAPSNGQVMLALGSARRAARAPAALPRAHRAAPGPTRARDRRDPRCALDVRRVSTRAYANALSAGGVLPRRFRDPLG